MDLKKIIKNSIDSDKSWYRQIGKTRRYLLIVSGIGALIFIVVTLLPDKFLLLIPASYIIGLGIIWAFFYGDIVAETVRRYTPKVSWNPGKHIFLLSAAGLIFIVFNIVLVLPSTSNKYLWRGSSLADSGDYKDAIKYLDMAVGLNSKNVMAYRWSGYVNHKLSNYGMAVDDYSQAIKLDPHNFVLYSKRGGYYRMLGRYKMAVADYARAVQMNPKDYCSYIGLGYTFCDMFNYSAALINYNKAVKINPLKAKGYRGRGVSYAWLGNYSAALADYNKALKIDPNAYGYEDKGFAYYHMHEYKKAIPYLKQAAATDSNLRGKMNYWIDRIKRKINNKKPAQD